MTKTAQSNQSQAIVSVTLAPFWKKLAAWVYDLLGALAVFILALAVGLAVIHLIATPWVEDRSALSAGLYSNPLWAVYLFACVQYYYVWCWVKGGQTMGMKTWRLKVCKQDGALLTWKEAYIRSFASLAGVSQIWSIIDGEHRGLHDFIFDTRIVELPKDSLKQDKPLI